MENFAPEVLIYLQTVKDFFTKDKEAKSYFIINDNEEFFFHHVQEISQKNFESFGEPSLSQMQFEFIRKTMILIDSLEKPVDSEPEGKFEYFGDFGKFYLN